jgi:uncharacterized surface protein with fasciclin (FAS1) repeats
MSHSIPDSSGLNILSRVESLILIVTGLGAGWLAMSESYTLLIDSSFRLVTLSGAIGITAMGLTGLVNARKTGLSGLLTFVLFFAIVLIGRPFASDSPSAQMTGIRAPENVVVESSDFPEMDISELDRQLKNDVPGEFGVAASILGKVIHMPHSDRYGQWILMRSYMICCVADAISVGFRVAGKQPAAFKEGDWVVVRGYVKKLPRFVSSPNIRLGVAMFSKINEEFIIEPVQVVSLVSTYPSLIEELDAEHSAKFLNALKVAGLLERIDAKGPFTLFVPHQQAFDIIDFDPFDGSLPANEREAVNRWLTKHIMVGKYTRKQLFYEESLQTIDGEQIDIRGDNGRLILEDSRVLHSDITANNGIIHLIYPGLKRN